MNIEPTWTRKRPGLYRRSPTSAEKWARVERGGEAGLSFYGIDLTAEAERITTDLDARGLP